MKSKSIPPMAFRPGRHFELPDDPFHDPYHVRRKYASPSVCRGCHAVYRAGRWLWDSVPADAATTLCPACQRINDAEPGGYVTVSGRLTPREHDDMLRMVRELEEREQPEHPLQRLMDIQKADGEVCITTTSPHLAQAIGTAIEAAFGGETSYAFSPAEHRLRVRWERHS